MSKNPWDHIKIPLIERAEFKEICAISNYILKSFTDNSVPFQEGCFSLAYSLGITLGYAQLDPERYLEIFKTAYLLATTRRLIWKEAGLDDFPPTADFSNPTGLDPLDPLRGSDDKKE